MTKMMKAAHMAVQYAKAIGLHVIAVDIHQPKFELAKTLHADMIINATEEDPVAKIQQAIKGAHGILATAVRFLIWCIIVKSFVAQV